MRTFRDIVHETVRSPNPNQSGGFGGWITPEPERHPGVHAFWPADFTIICPVEITAVHHRVDPFVERGVEWVSASIDSMHTRYAWRETPIDKGGIGGVQFPIVADLKHAIA
jgi:alkyl hydroperoxide reductase subunit AhpC